MRTTRHSPLLWLLPWAVLAACAGAPAEPAEPPEVAGTIEVAQPVQLVEPAAEPEAAPVSPPNRDPHGMADVDGYIRILQSEGRIQHLQVPRVVETLAFREDDDVADIGCGPGVFAIPFAQAIPSGLVFAVDVEPRQLDSLREKLLALRLQNVVPVLASFSDPHLPPGRMDTVFIGDTYHHIQDRVAYFTALRSDIADGGRLVLLEYKDGRLPVGPPPDHKVESRIRHSELEQAGYRLEQVFDFHEWHDFEVWRP